MRTGIIDRFEGEYAVVEFDGITEDILKTELPADIKAGDTLIFDNNKITIDTVATDSRKEEIITLMDELFEE